MTNGGAAARYRRAVKLGYKPAPHAIPADVLLALVKFAGRVPCRSVSEFYRLLEARWNSGASVPGLGSRAAWFRRQPRRQRKFLQMPPGLPFSLETLVRHLGAASFRRLVNYHRAIAEAQTGLAALVLQWSAEIESRRPPPKVLRQPQPLDFAI